MVVDGSCAFSESACFLFTMLKVVAQLCFGTLTKDTRINCERQQSRHLHLLINTEENTVTPFPQLSVSSISHTLVLK
ncbi:hypothetical protein IHE45_13G056600 [Dioscorea alata]|uniref:Uncharacterized protein n=1 Tax=Dioscorea alata TaxID=55571 RepID=A0ACB7UYE0_DIOAL|nr:hypothetical protein IHE45_13G056600 [Dioscorea alata]